MLHKSSLYNINLLNNFFQHNYKYIAISMHVASLMIIALVMWLALSTSDSKQYYSDAIGWNFTSK